MAQSRPQHRPSTTATGLGFSHFSPFRGHGAFVGFGGEYGGSLKRKALELSTYQGRPTPKKSRQQTSEWGVVLKSKAGSSVLGAERTWVLNSRTQGFDNFACIWKMEVLSLRRQRLFCPSRLKKWSHIIQHGRWGLGKRAATAFGGVEDLHIGQQQRSRKTTWSKETCPIFFRHVLFHAE